MARQPMTLPKLSDEDRARHDLIVSHIRRTRRRSALRRMWMLGRIR